jgi:hypothetical protein
MGKGKGTKTYIGEDGQLHPVICGVPECQNSVKDNQEKYCCDACRKRAMTLRSMEAYKGVYKDFDGWAGGPRGLSTVPSSIKHNETHVTGDGRFVVDDYRVDPEIFAIAEANHEKYVLDRNEYEARVVIDGLEIFVDEYNKHHKKTYAYEQQKKREANITKDQLIGRRKRNREYFRKNRKKILANQKARYKANPEKYNKIRKKYNYYTKQPDLFKYEKWLKKRISGS